MTAIKEDGAGKYSVEILIRAFRKAAQFRNEMNAEGFTDNIGALHSAERILNILGLRLNYPGLNHINNLRDYEGAEFSIKARAAHRAGNKVLIEHVSPIRAFTRGAIEIIESGKTDKQLTNFVRKYYQFVLLTQEETIRLNKHNRTEMTPDRLSSAGIKLAPPH